MNSLCGDELILGNKDGQYLRLSADEIVTMAPTHPRYFRQASLTIPEEDAAHPPNEQEA
jgi:hypothetical protein